MAEGPAQKRPGVDHWITRYGSLFAALGAAFVAEDAGANFFVAVIVGLLALVAVSFVLGRIMVAWYSRPSRDP